MQKTLFNFIEKFILCDSCHLPEVVILVDKKRAKVAKKCASCGIKIKVDPLHKLTSFIAKKPPSYKKSHLRKKPETHKQSQPEKQTIAQKQNDDSDWDDDIDSEDGLKNDDERDAAPAKFYKNSLTENEENTSILEDMLSENASVDQLMAEVGRMELASPSGKILGKLVILQGVIQAMFGGAPKESNRSVLAIIEKQRDFLSELMAADERNPANFLVALEDLVRNKRSDLLKGLPMFLEKLYDLEILGEEEMIKWFENVEDDDKVSLSCGVFVDWLKEAETEESG
ncbi:Eukaryotic translation initiation factor 5A-1, variant 2 [Bonamia ostreae]